jgi:hypothetical protein
MEIKMTDFKKLIALNIIDRKNFLVLHKDFKLISWEPKWHELGYHFDLKSSSTLPLENSSKSESLSFSFPNSDYELNEIYLPQYDLEDRTGQYKFDAMLLHDIELHRKGQRLKRLDFLIFGGIMSDKRYQEMQDDIFDSGFIEDNDVNQAILKSVYQHDFSVFKSDETIYYNSPTRGFEKIEFNIMSKPLSLVAQFTRGNEHVIRQRKLIGSEPRHFIYFTD